MTQPVVPLLEALAERSVRYLLIDVSGANMYAPAGGARFVTQDYDFFLPLDAGNLVRAWSACEAAGLSLWLHDEPLDTPRDLWLAERMMQRRALTRVTGPNDLQVDLTLVMKGFEFETVWRERRPFNIEGAQVVTARLLHIIESKQATGRLKDQLFLTTHEDALKQLLEPPEDPLPPRPK